MDQPDLPEADHRLALRGLARINRFTGVAKKMFAWIRTLANEQPNRTLRLLDVASGSGDLPIEWAVLAAREGLSIDITTLDISAVAAQTQQRNAEQAGVNITPLRADCLNSALPSGYDLLTNSLFMHHLDRPDVIKLIGSMHAAANQQVLICDLDRSRTNLALVSVGAHLLSRSPVVHTDAKLSVHGAYTADEFRDCCRQAIPIPVSVRKVFPCRFISTWRTS
ncbi:hypothetical protein K239x_35140 [Planctomycetes bacterium K23_9]|uniref:Methyltransferase domain-containing protein n=2 Tax=Stieleria marina TaxID=1930275 RepID=A0A517NWP9_9BACT|nr:hypothetical protein K239x_35140 [Planctomycetes bacterium K23_9]